MSLRRVAPLSGIVFVVLAVVAIGVLGGNTPGIKASPEKVASFYGAHHTRQETAGHLLVIAVAFLAFFVSSWWPLLRHSRRLWSALFFGGGLIAAAGFLLAAGIHIALADGAHHNLEPAALQALNAIDADDYSAFAGGLGIMLVGAGGVMQPIGGAFKWLGWVALVLGISLFTPLGFIGFLGGGLWIVVVSVWLFARPGALPDAASASGATT